MVCIAENAPPRDRSRLVEFLAFVKKTLARKPQFPKDMSDHLGRDIGMSAHDLELLRHELPSKSVNHPMI